MMQHHISELIYRRLLGTATPEEADELRQWMEQHPDNADFVRSLCTPQAMQHDLEAAGCIDHTRPARDMMQRISLMRRAARRRRLAIAASIALLIAIGIGAVTYLTRGTHLTSDTPVAAVAVPATLDDIHHGTTRARLTGPAGPALDLTAAQSGIEASAIARTDPSATPAAPHAAVEQYCLDVPRGGEFKIILEDSTEVWLNSESRLHYPATFAANERRIRITGEAYLKVHKDPDRPFYVESRGQEVRVYGTAFNIKAYEDEPVIYTTLESGSISLRPLSGYGGEIIMSPGHQALFDCREEKVNMRTVKPSVITGWRNGRFVFEEQDLESIMRDLSRWYDFDYEFADERARRIVFLGSIPRYSDFTTAIAILESSGGLKFSLRDNKVIITTSDI